MENEQVKLTKTLLYSSDEDVVAIDVIIDYDNEIM